MNGQAEDEDALIIAGKPGGEDSLFGRLAASGVGQDRVAGPVDVIELGAGVGVIEIETPALGAGYRGKGAGTWMTY